LHTRELSCKETCGALSWRSKDGNNHIRRKTCTLSIQWSWRRLSKPIS